LLFEVVITKKQMKRVQIPFLFTKFEEQHNTMDIRRDYPTVLALQPVEDHIL